MGGFLSKNHELASKAIKNELVADASIETPPMMDISIDDDEVEVNNPSIVQTPLTKTIASHLNKIAQNDLIHNPLVATPSHMMRKKILQDLGYTCSFDKILRPDPRSPSQAIPRTPLNLTQNIDEQTEDAFNYEDKLVDKSIQTFNERLAQITLDDIAEDDQTNDTEDVPEDDSANNPIPEDGNVDQVSVKSTPEADPPIDKCTNEALNDPQKEVKKTPAKNDQIENVKGPAEERIMAKNASGGRIPLSVVNRRGISCERTPISRKNKSSNIDFNNENHCAQRPSSASKIPVYFKK